MKKLIAAAAAALLALAGAAPCQAQDWPTRADQDHGGLRARRRHRRDGARRGRPARPRCSSSRWWSRTGPASSNTLAADATAKSTDGHTMVMGVVTAHAIAPHLHQAQLRQQPATWCRWPSSAPCPTCWWSTTACRPTRCRRWSQLAKKEPGQAQLRHQRRRQHAAHRGRDVQGRDRHRHHARALQGQRPGAGRPDRRPGADELRHHALGDRPDQERQGPRARRDHRQAQPAAARRADHGRSGRAGRGDERLVRHLHAGRARPRRCRTGCTTR